MLGELDMPADEHPSRPRSNSVVNAEIEQMIAELRTRDEEHHARMVDIRHSGPFLVADADLFRRAGILGSREAIRLQSMSRNAAARASDSAPLTPAGKNFMEQLPVADENDFPDETSCGICMDSYGSTDEPESRARLPCGHLMGRRCIERWLETCNTCPLCRHVLFEEDAESPAFLELQEILQRLGPAFTTLFLRIMDHVTYSGTSGGTEPRSARRIQEAVSSIEDVINSIPEARRMQEAVSRPNTSSGTDPSQAVTTTDVNPEEVPITENEVDLMWREVVEIRHQQDALEVRAAAYDSDAADGLLGPESGAELERLIALNKDLFDRWEDARWDMLDDREDYVVVRELLGSERLMEFDQLLKDNQELALRLENCRLRRQEMMEMHGISLSRAE